MLNTFEMRWFFSECPLPIDAYFDATTELQRRTDWYAFPCGPDCGIKLREGMLETKIRYHVGAPQTIEHFHGRMESYKKWSLTFPRDDAPNEEELGGAGWLEVQKERRLKRFQVSGSLVSPSSERPINGCEFELTKLEVRQGVYWTVGFEAVGAPEHLSDNLIAVLLDVTDGRTNHAEFDLRRSMGYAEWLSQLNRA